MNLSFPFRHQLSAWFENPRATEEKVYAAIKDFILSKRIASAFQKDDDGAIVFTKTYTGARWIINPERAKFKVEIDNGHVSVYFEYDIFKHYVWAFLAYAALIALFLLAPRRQVNAAAAIIYCSVAFILAWLAGTFQQWVFFRDLMKKLRSTEF